MGDILRAKFIRPTDVKILDVSGGRVSAVVSTEAKDRDGDIIRQEFWNLKDFESYSPLIASHNYFDLRSVIGEWESMEVKGKKLVGVARYEVGKGNEQADWGYHLASKGMAAYSVGFQPDMSKATRLDPENTDGWPTFEYRGQKLLEVSQVSVPSNPEALQRMKATGGLPPVISDVIDEALADIANDPEDDSPAKVLLDDKDFIAAIAAAVGGIVREDVKAFLEEAVLAQASNLPHVPPEEGKKLTPWEVMSHAGN